MKRDLKEVIGALMRVLDGGEVSQAELMNLSFDAHGELHAALTDAISSSWNLPPIVTCEIATKMPIVRCALG